MLFNSVTALPKGGVLSGGVNICTYISQDTCFIWGIGTLPLNYIKFDSLVYLA